MKETEVLSEAFSAINKVIDKWEKDWSVRNLFMEGLESHEIDEILGDLKKTIEDLLSEELKCGGCDKTVKRGTVWTGKVYGFYGTPVCEECVKKGKSIPLDPEREIGLILEPMEVL